LPKNYKSKMKNEVALKKLQALIDRMLFWNSNYAKFYRIEAATLVGSMAKNDQFIGDIDICMDVQRVREFCTNEQKSDYSEWRKEILGYAPPRDFSSGLHMYSLDVSRFAKNRDGRIDILWWNQLKPISLTMTPVVTLAQNGVLLFDSASKAISNAKPITLEQGQEIIKSGFPENPRELKGEYWDSYCDTLKKYPEEIRRCILERDNNTNNYLKYVNA
jgi:hypothetical protein